MKRIAILMSALLLLCMGFTGCGEKNKKMASAAPTATAIHTAAPTAKQADVTPTPLLDTDKTLEDVQDDMEERKEEKDEQKADKEAEKAVDESKAD